MLKSESFNNRSHHLHCTLTALCAVPEVAGESSSREGLSCLNLDHTVESLAHGLLPTCKQDKLVSLASSLATGASTAN